MEEYFFWLPSQAKGPVKICVDFPEKVHEVSSTRYQKFWDGHTPHYISCGEIFFLIRVLY